MLIDPMPSSREAGWGLPRRRPRYIARIPIRRKAGLDPRPAPAEPLSCWHVWLTDGLVPTAEAPAETFGSIFARAEAIAAERAAAYRAHEVTIEEIRPSFDFRA